MKFLKYLENAGNIEKTKNLKNAKSFKKAAVLMSVFFCVLLSSCFGVKADITINPDNSGTMILEYRVSRLLESLGRQDGNEAYLPLPVGKTDFERSIGRLPGMELVSFSSKSGDGDLTLNAELSFADMETLLAFLDPPGEKAVYQKTDSAGTGNSLTFNLNGGGGGENSRMPPESPLAQFFSSVSEGYTASITLNLPSSGSLDAPILPEAETITSGKKLSFSAPLSAILNSRESVVLKFNW